MIADTSGLLAYFNRSEPRHAEVAAAVDRANEPIVVSPFVVAEVDYLVATRLGVGAELAVGRELAGGAYAFAPVDLNLLNEAYDVVERYRDQNVGVADASIVVLAQRWETRRVLTFDRRHFDVLRTAAGEPFEIVP